MSMISSVEQRNNLKDRKVSLQMLLLAGTSLQALLTFTFQSLDFQTCRAAEGEMKSGCL